MYYLISSLKSTNERLVLAKAQLTAKVDTESSGSSSDSITKEIRYLTRQIEKVKEQGAMWKRREGRVRKAMRMLNAWIDDRGPLPWTASPSLILHPAQETNLPVSAAPSPSSSSTAVSHLKRLSKKELAEVRQQDKSLGRLLGLTRGKERLFLIGKQHNTSANGVGVRLKDGTVSTSQSVYERTDSLHTGEGQKNTGSGTGIEALSVNEPTAGSDIPAGMGEGAAEGADVDADIASQLAIWGVRTVSRLILY